MWRNPYLAANSWKDTTLKQGHYIWYTMGRKSLFGSCDDTLCSLCCEKLHFDPSGIVVNSDKVCSSFILEQVHTNPLTRVAGKDDGIRGSLGSGSSFAHVKQALTMCSMATDSPGHQTDTGALARHFAVHHTTYIYIWALTMIRFRVSWLILNLF